jgi:hypothetical protein
MGRDFTGPTAKRNKYIHISRSGSGGGSLLFCIMMYQQLRVFRSFNAQMATSKEHSAAALALDTVE